MIRRPPTATLFPTRRSSDLGDYGVALAYRPPGEEVTVLAQDGQGVNHLTVNANGVKTGSCGSVDRKSTRLNSSHVRTSYAVFCLKKKTSIRTDVVRGANISI